MLSKFEATFYEMPNQMTKEVVVVCEQAPQRSILTSNRLFVNVWSTRTPGIGI